MVITTVRGDAVRTEALTYLINRARITNDQPVLLTSANLEIRGTGLDLDLNNGRLTLGGRVACIIR